MKRRLITWAVILLMSPLIMAATGTEGGGSSCFGDGGGDDEEIISLSDVVTGGSPEAIVASGGLADTSGTLVTAEGEAIIKTVYDYLPSGDFVAVANPATIFQGAVYPWVISQFSRDGQEILPEFIKFLRDKASNTAVVGKFSYENIAALDRTITQRLKIDEIMMVFFGNFKEDVDINTPMQAMFKPDEWFGPSPDYPGYNLIKAPTNELGRPSFGSNTRLLYGKYDGGTILFGTPYYIDAYIRLNRNGDTSLLIKNSNPVLWKIIEQRNQTITSAYGAVSKSLPQSIIDGLNKMIFINVPTEAGASLSLGLSDLFQYELKVFQKDAVFALSSSMTITLDFLKTLNINNIVQFSRQLITPVCNPTRLPPAEYRGCEFVREHEKCVNYYMEYTKTDGNIETKNCKWDDTRKFCFLASDVCKPPTRADTSTSGTTLELPAGIDQRVDVLPSTDDTLTGDTTLEIPLLDQRSDAPPLEITIGK